jgi:hypothetical protein
MSKKENPTVKIESQKFLKIVKETMLDFKSLGNNPELVESLENILAIKKLTLINVSLLLNLIIKRKHLQNTINLLEISLGGTQSMNVLIEKEHNYMLHYIAKSFVYEVDNDGNVFCITKREVT